MYPTRLRLLWTSLGLILLASVWVVILQSPAKAQSSEQLEQGASLYIENCAVCHGPDGAGRVGATLAKDWPSIRPSATIRTIIERGVQGSVMPAWGEQYGGPLSSDQIDALVAYILSWQTGGAWDESVFATPTSHPPVSPVPGVEGDPNRGASLFGENCAVCHGPNGEGRIGATLSKDWAGIRPDLTVKTTIQRGIPGSVMPAWGQEYGGPLGETDVNDLTAFILSRPAGNVEQVSPAVDPNVSPVSASWLRGGWGIVVFAVLAIALIAGALIFQRNVKP